MPLWLHCSHPVSITQFQFRFYMNIKVFQYGGLQECTWWLIPLSKRLITPGLGRLTLLIPLITGVIPHLLTGMSHQVSIQSPHSACGFRKHPRQHPEDLFRLLIRDLCSWPAYPQPSSVGMAARWAKNPENMNVTWMWRLPLWFLDVDSQTCVFFLMICSYVQDPACLLTNFIGFLEDKHVFYGKLDGWTVNTMFFSGSTSNIIDLFEGDQGRSTFF